MQVKEYLFGKEEMRHALPVLALLVMLPQLNAQEATVAELRGRFESRVLQDVGQQLDAMDSQRLMEIVGEAAKEVFLAHPKSLCSAAEEEFKALPEFDRSLSNDYRQCLLGKLTEAEAIFQMYSIEEQPALLVDGWSPTVVARRSRDMALARSLKVEAVAARSVLTKLIGEKYWRLNADYRQPLIGIEIIGELCVVKLSLDESTGMYTPILMRRYKRKPEPEDGQGR
jgi:hypothetical protein